MSISIIVAVAQDNAIGKNNQLLCRLPADLKRFKRITSGRTLIMGRNTWLSLPKRPLPNRKNIVITDQSDDSFEGCLMVDSIDNALKICDSDYENFIIGGASVYRQFIPFAHKLYVTQINKQFDADTFFPAISEWEWELTEEEIVNNDAEADFTYSFKVFCRKRN